MSKIDIIYIYKNAICHLEKKLQSGQLLGNRMWIMLSINVIGIETDIALSQFETDLNEILGFSIINGNPVLYTGFFLVLILQLLLVKSFNAFLFKHLICF